jgi:hypothetical protein
MTPSLSRNRPTSIRNGSTRMPTKDQAPTVGPPLRVDAAAWEHRQSVSGSRRRPGRDHVPLPQGGMPDCDRHRVLSRNCGPHAGPNTSQRALSVIRSSEPTPRGSCSRAVSHLPSSTAKANGNAGNVSRVGIWSARTVRCPVSESIWRASVGDHPTSRLPPRYFQRPCAMASRLRVARTTP